MINLTNSMVASSDDWRKRRKFMDEARPFLQNLVSSETLYEDSSFKEIGLSAEHIQSLKQRLEEAFGITYGLEWNTVDSLGMAFDVTSSKKEFLPHIATSTLTTAVALGVPLWLMEQHQFLLKSERGSAELTYEIETVLGDEVVRFSTLKASGPEADEVGEEVIVFALSELARREAKGDPGDVKEMWNFIEKNPGWAPLIVATSKSS